MPGERLLLVDDSPTIRKVAEHALRAKGYEVILAADGVEALGLVEEAQPALILLDFVMPRMNGYQFCRVLQGIANLRDTPVILLSVKAEKVGEQFIQQGLVVDVVSKPFAPEALVGVVEHVLEKVRRGEPVRRSVEPSREPIQVDEEPEEAADADPAGRAAAERARAARRMADLLAERALEALGDLSEEGLQEARRRMTDRLSSEVLSDLAVALRLLEPGRDGDAVLTGDLTRVPLGEVMQLLELQKQTGTLEVVRGGVELAVGFRNGLIDLAHARGGRQEFLLGRYLLEEDLVSRQDLDLLLKNRAGSKRLLGDQLVKLGYITQEDLRRALTRQTSEVVYEVLRWEEGVFRFLHGAHRPETRAARLGLSVASILLEGFRRVDEWRLMEPVIGDFDAVFAREEAVLEEAPDLSRDERIVLDFVNGRSTVREVIERSHLSSFEACRILYRLVRARIIRRRSAAAA